MKKDFYPQNAYPHLKKRQDDCYKRFNPILNPRYDSFVDKE